MLSPEFINAITQGAVAFGLMILISSVIRARDEKRAKREGHK